MYKILMFICILSLPLSLFSQGTWQEKNALYLSQQASEFPSDRTRPISFNIGNKIFYGAGFYEHTVSLPTYYNDFFAFDLTTNLWSKKNNLSFLTRAHAISFSVWGKGYACLGFNELSGGLINDCWEYDTITDSWTQKASFTGTLTSFPIGFTSNEKLYVLTGMDSMSVLHKDIYEFDPIANLWTQKNNFPGPARINAQSFTINNNGYILGGNDTTAYFSDLWLYDSAIDTFIQKTDCIKASPYTFSVATSSSGYLCKGNTDSLIVYDPVADSWSLKNPVPGFSPTSTLYNDSTLYLINFSQSVYRYDEINDSWQKLYDRPKNVGGKTIILNQRAYSGSDVYEINNDSWSTDSNLSSLDNWLFAINDTGYGFINGNFAAYDPVSHTIINKTPYPGSPDPGCSFTLSGKGFLGVSETSNDLWQYDPSVDQWLQKSNFPVGPRLLTNSFSISNKGYLYSGWDPDSGVSVNDFWEYDPANDIWNQKATPPGPGRVGSIASGGNFFGYAGLGSEIAASQFDDIYEYDQQNNSWATIINPFGFRSGTIDFVYNDHLYVGGGFLRFSGTEYIAQYDLREYTPQFINSVNELTLSKSVSVYPVPTLNDIIVMSDEEITFIEIFDVMGQVKYRRKKNEGSKLNLNVDFLTAGIYFIRCNSNNKVVRFVKE